MSKSRTFRNVLSLTDDTGLNNLINYMNSRIARKNRRVNERKHNNPRFTIVPLEPTDCLPIEHPKQQINDEPIIIFIPDMQIEQTEINHMFDFEL